MYNIHAHAWDPEQHIAPATRAEADRSRGRPMDLSTPFDALLADNAPFAKTVVFGLKARRTGYWVPDAYVAAFVARAPEQLLGFACCEPTQAGALVELRHGIEELGLVGVKMVPMYAGFDPRDVRCQPIYAYCQENGLPILFHSGTTFNQNAPSNLHGPGSLTKSASATQSCAWCWPMSVIRFVKSVWWSFASIPMSMPIFQRFSTALGSFITC